MDNILDEFLTTFKTLNGQKKSIESDIKSLREEWEGRIFLNGNYQSAVGKITIRPASVRSSYDKKKVEKVIAKLMNFDAELAAELAGARTDTPIDQQFVIE